MIRAEEEGIRLNNRVVLFFMLTMMLASALPIFMDVYRSNIFGAVSYDDYAPYLLWLLGEQGGAIPPSPFVYRIGSVILAAPFYELPLIMLNGGGGAPEQLPQTLDRIRATQAICAANIFFVYLSAATIAAYLNHRLRASPAWSFAAALVFLLISRYMALGSVDGIATFPLLLTILCAVERRLTLFIILLAADAVINEKIIITCLLFVGLRALFCTSSRKENLILAIPTLATLLAYLAIVASVALPGADNQRNPNSYLPAIVTMSKMTFDPKGFYLNLWPACFLGIMWGIGTLAPSDRRFTAISDIGVAVGLALVAFVLDVRYNVGRIVMYSAPLFLIGAVQSIDQLQRPRFRKPGAAQSADAGCSDAGDIRGDIAQAGQSSHQPATKDCEQIM